MAEENNNLSRISCEVGTFEETDNCPKLHLCVDINTEIANTQQQQLKDAGLADEFTEFSIVFAIDAVPG